MRAFDTLRVGKGFKGRKAEVRRAQDERQQCGTGLPLSFRKAIGDQLSLHPMGF